MLCCQNIKKNIYNWTRKHWPRCKVYRCLSLALFLTFTPRVEQHDDVIACVLRWCGHALRTACHHGETESANQSSWWGVDAQLEPVPIVLHNLGLPLVICQLLDQWDDDVCTLWHQWTGSWDTTHTLTLANLWKLNYFVRSDEQYSFLNHNLEMAESDVPDHHSWPLKKRCVESFRISIRKRKNNE